MQQLRSFFDQFFGKRQPGRGHGYSELLFFLPMVGGSFGDSRINPQHGLKA